MAVSLYVGNLPYSISEDELSDLFAQAGTVLSVRVPTDRETRQPRGFAFVEMEREDEAQEAIRRFDGYRMDNRALRVNIAEERPARAGRPSEGGGGRRWR